MHVLKTTSPVAMPTSSGAPKSQPSKTAPVSRASRPRVACGTAGLERSSANGCSLRVRGSEPLIVAEVGEPTVDHGEKDTTTHRGAKERGVARQRAHWPLPNAPLGVRIDDCQRAPPADAQARLGQTHLPAED